MEDKILRTLSIKAFHIASAEEGEKFSLERKPNKEYILHYNASCLQEFAKKEPLIHSCSMQLIRKEDRHCKINSIMDIFPISAKVLGRIGEGITHTLTGIYVILTATDTERHDYQDIERPGKDKVVLVKLVSGQGAMYDTHYLAPEPSGFIGSHSIIDSTGSPMIISPNEYRDGAIRALY